MKPSEFYFKFGFRIEDAVRNNAPSSFVKKLRALMVEERDQLGYSLFGFGWKWWSDRWSLEREAKCLRIYAKTGSIQDTAERMECYCIEVAYLAHSVDALLSPHEHKFRGNKICTFLLLEKVSALAKNGMSKAQISKELGVKGTYLNAGLKTAGIETMWAWRSDDEKALAISLYEKGIVPKEMHKHGVTAAWPTIYLWVREANVKPIRKNLRQELRVQWARAFPEDKWKAYSKLVRRLTEDTYKKNRDVIDPQRLRGQDWHLDHKVSIFKAFSRDWSPEKAASTRNLQMLTEIENRRKYVN